MALYTPPKTMALLWALLALAHVVHCRPWMRSLELGDYYNERPSLPSLAQYRDLLAISSHPVSPRPSSKQQKQLIEHFSRQVEDSSLYLHSLFRPETNSTALAYTISSQYKVVSAFYAYLFSDKNKGHLSATPVNPDDMVVHQVYTDPRIRRTESGRVDVDIKYGEWSVIWRGVEMVVHAFGLDHSDHGLRLNPEIHVIVNALPKGDISPKLFTEPQSQINLAWKAKWEQDKDGSISDSAKAEMAASAFLVEIARHADSLDNTVLVFDDNEWVQDKHLWGQVQKASWEDVILDEQRKEEIKKEYTSFFAAEQIYKTIGAPWKRGLVFYGPPGNGKTITLKAIMRDAGVPVLYVRNTGSWSGSREMTKIFEVARREAPCLLILEDIDSLITDNNRSFFLNQIDGLEENDGILIIATTNHLDKLDPGLANRPSRFDRKYNFDNPSQDVRLEYVKYWQDKLAGTSKIEIPESFLLEFAEQAEGLSFAYMKEAFMSALMSFANKAEGSLAFAKILLEQVKTLKESINATQPSQSAPSQDLKFSIIPPMVEIDAVEFPVQLTEA